MCQLIGGCLNKPGQRVMDGHGQGKQPSLTYHVKMPDAKSNQAANTQYSPQTPAETFCSFTQTYGKLSNTNGFRFQSHMDKLF